MPLSSGHGVVLAEVQVGTPWQTMKVVPDTGSYSMVLASTLCTSDGACNMHTLFNVSRSSSFQADELGRDWEKKFNRGASFQEYTLTYGQGKVAGLMGRDRIGVPLHPWSGQPEDEVAFESGRVSMLEMTHETLRGWSEASYDGIMGMGKNSNTDTNTKSFLSEANITSFDLCLGEFDETATGKGGRLELNGRISSGEYRKLDSIGEHAWGIKLNSIGIGDVEEVSYPKGSLMSTSGGGLFNRNQAPMRLCADEPSGQCAAIVDSGTTLLAVPSTMLQMLEQTIEAECSSVRCLQRLAEQETCNGDVFDALPDINLKLAGKNVKLEPSSYMGEFAVELLEGNVTSLSPLLNTSAPFHMKAYDVGVRCIPMLMDMEVSTDYGPMVIMGMPFLRQYATEFNREDGSLSIAEVPAHSTMCQGCPSSSEWNSLAEFRAWQSPKSSQTAAATSSKTASKVSQLFARSSSKVSSKGAPSQGALVPDANEPKPAEPTKAASESRSRQKRPLRAADIKLPWWAVDPKKRPAAYQQQQHLHLRGGRVAAKGGHEEKAEEEEPWVYVL